MAVATGQNAVIALNYETTFGTSPASGYFALPFVNFTLQPQRNLIEDNLIVAGRDPERPTRGIVETTGTTRVPLDLRGIGYWLKLFFGDPITTGVDPFTHVFSSGAAALPSASIEQQHADVPAYWLHNGVSAQSWTMTATPEGLAEMEINLVGAASPTDTVSNIGATTPTPVTRFNMFEGVLNKDSTKLGKVLQVSLPFNNNLEFSRYVGDAGVIGDIDPGRTSVEGEMQIRFDSLALFTEAENATVSELDLLFEITPAVSSLNFNLPQIELGEVGAPIEGPAGVVATFPFRASKTAGEQMLNVTLINDIASY